VTGPQQFIARTPQQLCSVYGDPFSVEAAVWRSDARNNVNVVASKYGVSRALCSETEGRARKTPHYIEIKTEIA
jgi:hypothetical protein